MGSFLTIMFIYKVHAWCHRHQKRASVCFELELQIVFWFHVDAWKLKLHPLQEQKIS